MSTAAEPTIREGSEPPPLSRNRNFMLLWSGQAISSIGTEVSAVAYPLLVLAVTGSPAKAGFVGFMQTLPFLLLYMVAGSFVDRLDRRQVMLVCDGVRALALGSIPLALALDSLTFAQIAAVAFVEGCALVFFYLAEGAALPWVVARSQLPSAVARNEARAQAAELAGRPLGGVLFGLGRVAPFLFDAITYAIGFLTVLGIRTPLQGERKPGRHRLLQDMREGARFVLRQPLLRWIAVLVSTTNFLGGALLLALIVRASDLGASASQIGGLFVLSGIAGILGAMVAPAVQRRAPPAVVILGSVWLWIASVAAMAIVPTTLALGAVYSVYVVAGPAFNVVLAQYRYALVPDRLLARVQSVSLTVGWGSFPLGSLAGGLLLEHAGADSALLVLAGAGAVLAAAVTALPTIRRAERPENLRLQDAPD